MLVDYLLAYSKSNMDMNYLLLVYRSKLIISVLTHQNKIPVAMEIKLLPNLRWLSMISHVWINNTDQGYVQPRTQIKKNQHKSTNN